MRHIRTVLVLGLLTLGASTAAPGMDLFPDPVGPYQPIHSVGPYADPVGLRLAGGMLAAP